MDGGDDRTHKSEKRRVSISRIVVFFQEHRYLSSFFSRLMSEHWQFMVQCDLERDMREQQHKEDIALNNVKCNQCLMGKSNSSFSKNQRSKSELRRCKSCIAGTSGKSTVKTLPIEATHANMVGRQVEIHSLTKKSSLKFNSEIGVIQKYDNGKFVVQVKSKKLQLYLLPTNVKLVSDSKKVPRAKSNPISNSSADNTENCCNKNFYTGASYKGENICTTPYSVDIPARYDAEVKKFVNKKSKKEKQRVQGKIEMYGDIYRQAQQLMDNLAFAQELGRQTKGPEGMSSSKKNEGRATDKDFVEKCSKQVAKCLDLLSQSTSSTFQGATKTQNGNNNK